MRWTSTDRFRGRFCLRRAAFTLTEAMLASTILAIVAAAAAYPFTAGVQNSNAAVELESAVELGEAMMEEIIARPFFAPGQRVAAPGPDSGESSRKLFNNADDFHLYSEGSDKILRDYNDNAVTEVAGDGFWREASVQYVSFPEQEGSDTNSIVHIQVRVYKGATLLATLDRLMCRED